MKITTILDELKKGETFVTEATVVYNKKKEKRVSKRTGNTFYTQFVLLQDDSTGYSEKNDSLPISLLVKSDDEIENGTILKVKGDVDVYNGKKTYNGTIQDFIVEYDDKPEMVQQAQEILGGEIEEEELKEEQREQPKKTYQESREEANLIKFEEELEKKKSIARSVAVKCVASMVAGKQIKLPGFWQWVYMIYEYVFSGNDYLPEEDEAEVEEEVDPEVLTDKQESFVKKNFLSSSYLTEEEKKKYTKEFNEGMTKTRASELIFWWIGDKQKGTVGERQKREEEKKVKEFQDNMKESGLVKDEEDPDDDENME